MVDNKDEMKCYRLIPVSMVSLHLPYFMGAELLPREPVVSLVHNIDWRLATGLMN